MTTAVLQPEPGQVWADGLNPGCSWTVVEIDELQRVGLVMSRGEEVTSSYMQWPLNRWQALVEKQLLSLESAA